ncbi:uridine kinase [Pontibacter ummariensis]|uniref:uridine/cytidine kinase n=1 Tax=Pontibacter ummariensis TaxID=1610492 RepID=A0A239B4A0_9BACT|nr:uridine-cytidine kinase [Pontibacter ummariensis]PRY16299.1 uridine kinase [Pontibacter ummariensis]SNS02755.1 uridine kinase [Pontibacter ummariensis]
MQKPFIVGITGGSASGKTTFLNKLLTSFAPENVCLISQDNYYKPRELQTRDRNGIVNFDLPSCIDDEAYAHDILKVSQGETVYRTEYTFNNPNVVPKQLEFRPAPIVVVEGIFVFYFEEIAKLLDLKVYIDAKEYIKLQRRIVRDRIERGYDLDDVLYRYTNHVAPTYEKYIKPYKNDADIIIPNNNHFEKGLEVIITFLNAKIKG